MARQRVASWQAGKWATAHFGIRLRFSFEPCYLILFGLKSCFRFCVIPHMFSPSLLFSLDPGFLFGFRFICLTITNQAAQGE